MKTFQVILTRSYIVNIEAENDKEACRCAEFFLGDVSDVSSESDQKEFNFRILEIEPALNDAIEAHEVPNDDE